MGCGGMAFRLEAQKFKETEMGNRPVKLVDSKYSFVRKLSVNSRDRCEIKWCRIRGNWPEMAEYSNRLIIVTGATSIRKNLLR